MRRRDAPFRRRKSALKSAGLLAAVARGVFAAGMAVTHSGGLFAPAPDPAAETVPGMGRSPMAGPLVRRLAADVPALPLEDDGARPAAACEPVRVHDGDTIRCGSERVRLADIDAPELPESPKCEGYRRADAWCDFALGYRSREALRAFLARGPVALHRLGEDRYGRTLAQVTVNGVGAGDYLVGQGLARPWR